MASFYNNLLSIEMTFLGIAIASVFVFIQIAHSNNSIKQYLNLFKDWKFLLGVILSSATVILTLCGSFFLSIEKHNYFKGYYFKTRLFLNGSEDVFFGISFPVIIVLFFIISISILSYFIYKNIKYIKPEEVLSIIEKGFKKSSLDNFLYKKYGISNPENTFRFNIILTDTSGKKISIDKKTENEDNQSEEEFKKEKLNNKDKYDKIIFLSKNSDDPLIDIKDIIVKSINTYDYPLFRSSIDLFFKISLEYLENLKLEAKTLKGNRWNPKGELFSHFMLYFTETINGYFETINKNGVDSYRIYILDEMEKVAERFIKDEGEVLNTLLKILKKESDYSIGKSSLVFIRINKILNNICDSCLEDLKEEDYGFGRAESVFKILGWISERLLSKIDIEEKPLMYDEDYYSEYDSIFNAILTYEYKLSRDFPKKDPLIYFDAVDVLSRKLIKKLKPNQTSGEIHDNFYSCCYCFFTFVEKAIKVNNSKSVALSIMRLKSLYNILVEKHQENLASEIVVLLVYIDVLLYKNSFQMGEWISQKNDLNTLILESPFRKKIEYAINESYIKNISGSKSLWDYLTSMGKKMNTNFGFMFDPVTGQTYSENDPRRR